MTITALPFDSTLFGYAVGKCQPEENWDEALFIKQAEEYRLVYIFSKKPIQALSKNIVLADVKLTFEKKLNSPNEVDMEISAYYDEVTDKLLALALESGVFSRFKTDPRFVNQEFEKLYKLWIENALEQRQVWIAEEYSGFVSCDVAQTAASIGLIAVDKNHRGKSWGKRLVKAAENFAIDRGAETLKIGTQEANAPAVALYQSLGYQVIERMYVYHYWTSLRR